MSQISKCFVWMNFGKLQQDGLRCFPDFNVFFFGLGWLTCGCARHYDCRIHGGGCHQLALAERLGGQAELVNLSSVSFEALVRLKPRNLQVLIAMAKFERSLSNNDLNKSMMQKIFLAQTLNIGTLDRGA